MFLRRLQSPGSLIASGLLLGACMLRVGGAGSNTDRENEPSEQLEPPPDAAAPAPLDAGAPQLEPPMFDAAAPFDAGRPTLAPTDSSISPIQRPDATPDEVVDAHAHDASPLGDAERPDADTLPTGCKLTGSYATEILFDVGWNQTTIAGFIPLLAAGTGQIRTVVRLDLGGSPERASARLTACGATLPDFRASNILIGTEHYAAVIPESAWESDQMPHPAFGLSFGCMAAGCALTTDPVVATFGARTNPNDVWPGRTGPLGQITPLDQDGDGHPGVTFVSRGDGERNAQGAAYVHIPVGLSLNARAQDADVAFRITGTFNGKVDSCDLYTGAVSSGSVEARAFGCRARRDNSRTTFDCASEQSAFLDQNLPAWQVRGGTFRVMRVADNASCSVVREALR
jgi:hypothetical protein